MGEKKYANLSHDRNVMRAEPPKPASYTEHKTGTPADDKSAKPTKKIKKKS